RRDAGDGGIDEEARVRAEAYEAIGVARDRIELAAELVAAQVQVDVVVRRVVAVAERAGVELRRVVARVRPAHRRVARGVGRRERDGLERRLELELEA